MIEGALDKVRKSPFTWILSVTIPLLIVGTVNAVNLYNVAQDAHTIAVRAETTGAAQAQASQTQIEQLKALVQSLAQAQAVQSQAARDQTAALDRRLTLIEERRP